MTFQLPSSCKGVNLFLETCISLMNWPVLWMSQLRLQKIQWFFLSDKLTHSLHNICSRCAAASVKVLPYRARPLHHSWCLLVTYHGTFCWGAESFQSTLKAVFIDIFKAFVSLKWWTCFSGRSGWWRQHSGRIRKPEIRVRASTQPCFVFKNRQNRLLHFWIRFRLKWKIESNFCHRLSFVISSSFCWLISSTSLWSTKSPCLPQGPARLSWACAK